jgi:hypothetical protein
MSSGCSELGRLKSKFAGKDEKCKEIVAALVDHRQGLANTPVNKLLPAMVGLAVWT